MPPPPRAREADPVEDAGAEIVVTAMRESLANAASIKRNAPEIVDSITASDITVAGMYEDSFMSARVVYTHRSSALFTSIAVNPVDSRYVQGFGLPDASLKFNLRLNFQLSVTASTLQNAAPHRFYGEPGYATGTERQHYRNGRVFDAAFRYSFGN